MSGCPPPGTCIGTDTPGEIKPESIQKYFNSVIQKKYITSKCSMSVVEKLHAKTKNVIRRLKQKQKQH